MKEIVLMQKQNEKKTKKKIRESLELVFRENMW